MVVFFFSYICLQTARLRLCMLRPRGNETARRSRQNMDKQRRQRLVLTLSETVSPPPNTASSRRRRARPQSSRCTGTSGQNWSDGQGRQPPATDLKTPSRFPNSSHSWRSQRSARYLHVGQRNRRREKWIGFETECEAKQEQQTSMGATQIVRVSVSVALFRTPHSANLNFFTI